MKYNIFMNIKGPGGESQDIPNNTNPVEADDLAACLHNLADNLPKQAVGIDVEVTGVRVVKVD